MYVSWLISLTVIYQTGKLEKLKATASIQLVAAMKINVYLHSTL